MSLIDLTPRSHAAPAPARARFSLLKLYDVWQSRRALARLDASRLADVGLSAKAAHREAQKPIWDVPDNWRA